MTGIVLAVQFLLRRKLPEPRGVLATVHRWIYNKYYVDEAYDALVVNRTKAWGMC